MDGWPNTWRSLSWLSLCAEIPGWLLRKILYRFDPKRTYP